MTTSQQITCGFMILTPTPEHDGGMWCAEEYPCKNHGSWKENKITSETTSTPQQESETPELTGEPAKRFHTFMMDHTDIDRDPAEFYMQLDNHLATELELQRREIEDIFDCPYVVESKTCPNGDVSRAEEAPEQVVGTLHMSYVKYKKLQDLLQKEQ